MADDDPKEIFLAADDSLVLQLADLAGEGGAIHQEKIGKLLAVEGDLENIAFVLLRLQLQVGEQAIPDLLFRDKIDLSRQKQVFFRDLGQEILHEPVMELAGDRADIEESADVEEHNIGILLRDDVNIGGGIGQAGIAFREAHSDADLGKDVQIAPEIVFFYHCHSLEQYAEGGGGFSAAEYVLVFSIMRKLG